MPDYTLQFPLNVGEIPERVQKRHRIREVLMEITRDGVPVFDRFSAWFIAGEILDAIADVPGSKYAASPRWADLAEGLQLVRKQRRIREVLMEITSDGVPQFESFTAWCIAEDILDAIGGVPAQEVE